METTLSILGFTTPESTYWNLFAYAAVVAIIIGIKYPKPRLWIFALCGAALAIYAFLFLKDMLFTVLQSVVALSAALQLLKENERRSKIILAGVSTLAFFALLVSGHLHSALQALGVLGFSGITLGIILLPFPKAFLIMAFGGAVLAAYAFGVGATAFFVLNIVFALMNVWEWHTTTKKFRTGDIS